MKHLRLIALSFGALTASVTHAIAATNADKLTDFAITKLNTVFDGVSKAMPTVTKYALQVTSMDCLVYFVPLLWMLPLVTIGAYLLYRTWVYAIKKTKEDDWDHPGYFFVSVIPTVAYGVVFMSFLDLICNGWRWIGIFHPDLYLIHLAIQKVTS